MVLLALAAVTTAFAGNSPARPGPDGIAPTSSRFAAGDVYVALGSSYAAGPGITPVVDVRCLRSGRNYPHQVAAALNLKLIDVTCSGATTANILRTPQRTRTGVGLRPQIDAVTPAARLVTVTVGGNDLGYIGSMTGQSCAVAVGKTFGAGSMFAAAAQRICHGVAGRPRPFPGPQAYARLGRSLTSVVSAIRNRAPAAQVLLVQYLPVLDAQATTCAAVPLDSARANGFAAEYRGLVTVTARVAKQTGAALVDAPTDHPQCGADPWVTGFELGDPLAGGPIPYHPNLAGATARAAAVVTRLRSTN